MTDTRADVQDYFVEQADRWRIDPSTMVYTRSRYSEVVHWLYTRSIDNEFIGTLYGRYHAWSIPCSQSRLLFLLRFPE
jgi:hypothetical protein